MSRYTAYSMLFTGEITDQDFGAKVNEYSELQHLFDTVHDEWAFGPEIQYKSDRSTYPHEEFAYLYGYKLSEDIFEFHDYSETWHLNKCGPGSRLFLALWKATAMVCEPFSVLMFDGSCEFPSFTDCAFLEVSPVVNRLDCQPGKIEIKEINLHTREEEVMDTIEWDTERYREEYFTSGVNY